MSKREITDLLDDVFAEAVPAHDGTGAWDEQEREADLVPADALDDWATPRTPEQEREWQEWIRPSVRRRS